MKKISNRNIWLSASLLISFTGFVIHIEAIGLLFLLLPIFYLVLKAVEIQFKFPKIYCGQSCEHSTSVRFQTPLSQYVPLVFNRGIVHRVNFRNPDKELNKLI